MLLSSAFNFASAGPRTDRSPERPAFRTTVNSVMNEGGEYTQREPLQKVKEKRKKKGKVVKYKKKRTKTINGNITTMHAHTK